MATEKSGRKKSDLEAATHKIEPAESDRSEDTALASEEGDSQAKPEKKRDDILEILKKGKEIVAIVIFFAGGIAWIYTAFATKKYVASVRCLLGATIERIDNEAQARVHNDEIIQRNVELQRIQGFEKNDVTGDVIKSQEALKARIDDLKSKKKLADEAIKRSAQRIINGECEE